ncbi:MAG: hypothetical protein HYT41_00015 [Candidatus Sungbacteria bacterium]|nr:hypothetical protein [Candidatus Sungbacteria bacterium]
MNGKTEEKAFEQRGAMSYSEETRRKHDELLEHAFGKPRYSRDMEEENPSAAWAYRRAVSDIYDSFEFINHDEIARVKAGEMKRENMAVEKVLSANNAEVQIMKSLARGPQEISDGDLALVSNQFKIHLQPQKEYAADVFARLIQCLSDDEELRALIPIFKASVAENPVRDSAGEPVPEVVLYTPTPRGSTGKSTT